MELDATVLELLADRVDIVDKSAENHGPLTITSFYVGYLLPMMVEVQHFQVHDHA